MSKIYFHHQRNIDSKGNVCNNGGITYAFTIDDNSIHFAVSICSKQDNFNKKLGRQISNLRLLSYLDGKQILTNKAESGRYPLAYTLNNVLTVDILINVVLQGVFTNNTYEFYNNMYSAIKVEDLSILLLSNIIDYFFNVISIPLNIE